jgi:hypothetical protein
VNIYPDREYVHHISRKFNKSYRPAQALLVSTSNENKTNKQILLVSRMIDFAYLRALERKLLKKEVLGRITEDVTGNAV